MDTCAENKCVFFSHLETQLPASVSTIICETQNIFPAEWHFDSSAFTWKILLPWWHLSFSLCLPPYLEVCVPVYCLFFIFSAALLLHVPSHTHIIFFASAVVNYFWQSVRLYSGHTVNSASTQGSTECSPTLPDTLADTWDMRREVQQQQRYAVNHLSKKHISC